MPSPIILAQTLTSTSWVVFQNSDRIVESGEGQGQSHLPIQKEINPSHQSMPLCFAARWCWQLFLYTLTGNGHLVLVQDVLWQNMILLPRAKLDCIFATVPVVFSVPSFQVRYILTFHAPGTLHQICFQGLYSLGIYP